MNQPTPPPDRLRHAAKRALGPMAAPVLHRLYTRVDQRTDARIEAQLGQPVVNTVTEQHLALILDALSASNAGLRELRRETLTLTERVGQLEAAVAPLDQRLRTDVEDLRRYVADMDQRMRSSRTELMYEMRYGTQGRGIADIVEPRILNPDKVAAKPLKVNVGSGHIVLEDHVNVDGRELEGVDVVADARRLPFDEGSIDELYSAHLIEHFPAKELERIVLPHWVSRLRNGGILRVVAPDANAMIEAYASGTMTFDDLAMVTYGEQEYDGDFHFAMYTPASLAAVLTSAGLTDVRVVASGRRNGASLEMELAGTRT